MIDKLICPKSYSLRQALEIIENNAKGVCFVVDNDLTLLGLLTDGDIRRSLLKNADLESNVKCHMNKNFLSLPHDSNVEKISKYLSNQKYKIIPLCRNNGKVVDYIDSSNLHSISILSPSLDGNELKYVTECITSSWISSQGKYVRKFEEIFESMHKESYALAVSSGTTALHLSLATFGLKEDDEVIVPDFTFAATINSVIYCGSTPVICEIKPDTWCIDEDKIEELITPKTKAIIPVHLYGQPCNMKKIMDIAKKHNLIVIEDCAEAVGSSIDKKLVGTFGDSSTFSFFGNKTITTGEGGMVLFKDKEKFNKARLLRDHGMNKNKKYWHEFVGFNYRITNLQAAVGVAQMERFEEIISRKQKIFEFYLKNLSNFEGIYKLPFNSKIFNNSSWLFTVIIDPKLDREKVISELNSLGIQLRPAFFSLSQMPPYKKYRHSDSLKNSLFLARHGISLPSSAMLTKLQLDYILLNFKKVVNKLIKYD